MSRSKPTAIGSTPLTGVVAVDTHGDEPMTPKQAAILRELAEMSGEKFDGGLSRKQAHDRIEYLKSKR